MRLVTGIAGLALILGLASTASAATAPAEAAVLVQGFSFQPPEVSIAASGSVTWTVGTDPEQHTVTPREAGSFEGSDQLFTGDTFTVTFDDPGTFEYFCSLHPNMVGTVEVAVPATPGASIPTPTPATSPTPSPGAAEPPPAGETGSGGQLLILAVALGVVVVVLGIWLARRRA